MAKKNEYLSAKERKRYSKLISERLLAMGIKDVITYHPTGKTRKYFQMDDSGKGLITNEDGTPKVFDKPVFIARNLHRNMVRTLRNSTRSVVNAFLNMPFTPKETK